MIVALRSCGGRRRPDRRVSGRAARSRRLAAGRGLCGARRGRSTRSPRRSSSASSVPASRSTCSARSTSPSPTTSGVAFGLAGGGGAPLVIADRRRSRSVVVGFLLAPRPERPGMWLAVGLLAGGALGNLIDRIRAGAVTDFIESAAWPPFNLADVAITARGRAPRPDLFAAERAESEREPSSRSRASSTSTSALAVVDKPAGLVVHPAPSHTRADPGRRARRAARRRRRPRAPRDRPPARQGHQRPARRRPRRRGPRRPAGAGRAREVERDLPGAGRGPARLAHRDDRRADRPRLAPAPPDGGRPGPPRGEARTHFAVLELLAARDLPRGAPGDRPHPPDPRPLRRDRPPAGRRPDLRRRRTATASSASSSTPTGSPSTTRQRRAARASAPSCRPTSRRRWKPARAA